MLKGKILFRYIKFISPSEREKNDKKRLTNLQLKM